jgi:hypothetical protein
LFDIEDVKDRGAVSEQMAKLLICSSRLTYSPLTLGVPNFLSKICGPASVTIQWLSWPVRDRGVAARRRGCADTRGMI